jgi:hypothetical protein
MGAYLFYREISGELIAKPALNPVFLFLRTLIFITCQEVGYTETNNLIKKKKSTKQNDL